MIMKYHPYLSCSQVPPSVPSSQTLRPAWDFFFFSALAPRSPRSRFVTSSLLGSTSFTWVTCRAGAVTSLNWGKKKRGAKWSYSQYHLEDLDALEYLRHWFCHMIICYTQKHQGRCEHWDGVWGKLNPLLQILEAVVLEKGWRHSWGCW